MRNFAFLIVGILFGIILTKSEAISWFRIHEMFRFESFHMYGIIGTAVVLGALGLLLMKRSRVKTLDGNEVSYKGMQYNLTRHVLAGSIFGLGWALVGSCPGPMYILVGHGYWIVLVILLSAIVGTFVYGVFGQKLPH
ncbi:MAG: DUF6691 family protein [Saprospiraceae bacterium]|nr:DUF6691 family protein [Saprospiraceae bacterium]